VQDRVFGEVQDDGEPVTLAAAEHDEIDAALPRRAQDLDLRAAAAQDAGFRADPELLREAVES